MARIYHNNHLDTIDSLFTNAKERGVLHLKSGEGLVTGRTLMLEGKELLNFGSLGYLGLELDERLKEGSIDYISRFGTQSVMSRTYISTSIITELEELLSQMYGYPALVYSRASATHISLIPTLIEKNDVIILDQQAHMSIQSAAQLQRQKGVSIEMIRHSNLEMLERKVQSLIDKHDNIWYMADGVYSMFGDVAPVKEIHALLDKYPQLHLYIDDCHGMSWAGKNGTGYVFGEGGLHERMMLITTMAKGFGCHGGVAIFPNEEWYRKVKVFGGPLSYSLPLSPGDIGAAVASAKIHLSDEIYLMQHELRDLVTYANRLLDESGLPVMSNPSTPIFFIGMGQPKVGYSMVRKLMDDGIYVNASFFPMVPVKNTGLRFGLTRNQTKEDIKALVDAVTHYFPIVLEEEGRNENQVRKAFKLDLKPESELIGHRPAAEDCELKVEQFRSIDQIDKAEWDKLFKDQGTFDWDGLKFMEEAFSGNELPEENWDFHYYVIRDGAGEPVVATFFTEGLYKDDFVALPSISKQIEEKRKSDPYYLTSKTLNSGSMISVGEHVFVNRDHTMWRKAVKKLIDEVSQKQDEVNARSVMLGDFPSDDAEMRELLLAEGFLRIDLPNANIIELPKGKSVDEILGHSRNNKKAIKREVLRFESCYEVEMKNSLTKEESDYFYQLFLNVKRRNYGLNFFDYPKNILEVMSKYPNWEFLVLNLKEEVDGQEVKKPVAVVWSYKSENHYSPMIIGMDYDYLESHKLYKQALYRVLCRASELNVEKLYMGFSADIEKRKFGAVQVPKVSYLQTKDNYNIEVIQSMGVMEAIQ